MKIGVSKDRKIFTSSSLAGTVNENYYEVLEFTFPEELENYTKYIEIQAEDLRYVDRIENNKFTISNELTKYEYLQVQIVCKDLQNNIVYKSNIFTLSTNDSLNIMEDISVEQRDLLDRVELELQEAKEDIEELQETQTEHTEQIQANATEIEALQGRVSTNEADIDNLETEVTNIKTKNAQQDNAINENTQDISDIKVEQTTQNNKIAGNTNRITVLESDSGNKVALSIDSNYVMTLQLLNKSNEVLSTGTIDLPIESMIVNASYSNGILTLTLQNGQTLNVDISDIVSGLVSETTFNNAVSRLEGLISGLDTRMTTAENNIANKVDKVAGKGLSTNDYTTAEKNKLANLENYDDTEVKESIADLEAKHDTEVAELNEKIADLQEEVDMASDLIPTGDESGSDITVNDSSRYYFKKIVPGGKSEQETFTGKNLLEVLTNVYKDRGLTTTKLSDGGFKVTGTAMSTYSFIIYNEPINLEPGTYTFSIKESLTTNLRLFPMLEDGTTEGSMTISAGSKSTTTTFTNKIIGIRILLFTTEGTNYDLTIYPMIEQGSTATAYEPYTGGQPAPNPSYECPIQNVTGNVEVKVENKNLYDGTLGRNGYYEYSGKYAPYVNGARSAIMEVKPNKRYALSTTFKNGFYNTLVLLDEKQQLISTINGINKNGAIVKTLSSNDYFEYAIFTTTTNCYYIAVGMLTNENDNYSKTVMLEEVDENATTPSDYIEHEEQTAIFPLEEGQRLHKDDAIRDKIVQRRKTKVFDGTENWVMNTNNDVYRYIISLPDRKEKGDGLSNYFKTTNSSLNEGLFNGISINFITREITTLADWKAWLAEKYANGTPLTLEYELETPIETPFTKAQKTAKAQIDKLISYKGTTHITSNANLDVTYRKDPNIRDTRLDALEARVSLLEG